MRKLLFVSFLLLTAAPLFAQALPESTLQMKLANDATFLTRVQYLMVQEARVVLTETGVGATHAARAAFAKKVIDFPQEYARKAASMLVGGVNLIGTVTYTAATAGSAGPPVVPATAESVTTTVTDGALFSQIGTFWNQMAQIDSGS